MGWGVSGRTRVRRSMVVAALVGAWVLMPTAASAHSELVSSNPSDGSVEDLVPDHVVLEFGEPVAVNADSVQVVGPDGEDRAIGVLGSTTGRLVSVAVEPVEQEGSWQVRYRVLGGDGHVVSGRVDFNVGTSSGGVASFELTPASAATIILLVAASGYLVLAPRLVRDLEGVR